MAPGRTAAEIELWLINYLADLLDISPDQIDPTSNFDEYGLDSALAVSLTGDLEDWLGTKINPTLLYNFTTIADLSANLGNESA